MKKATITLIIACFTTMLWVAPSLAEREVAGQVVSMDGSRIVIALTNGEKLRLDVSGQTMIFIEGGVAQVKRLLPGTKVRVSHERGHANTIIVKAVPK